MSEEISEEEEISEDDKTVPEAPMKDWRTILLMKYYEHKRQEMEEKLLGPDESQSKTEPKESAKKKKKAGLKLIDSDNSTSFNIADDLSHIPMENQWDSIHKDSIMHDQGISLISPRESVSKPVQYIEERMPTDAVTKKFQQDKPHKLGPIKIERDCVGCGTRPLIGPCFQCIDCGDIYLCHNCHTEKDTKHIAAHRFRSTEESTMTASKFMESGRAEQWQRPRLFSGSKNKKVQLSSAFDNSNMDEIMKSGDQNRVRIIIKNNGELPFPQDTTLKSTTSMNLFSDLSIGSISPGARHAEIISHPAFCCGENSYEFRLYSQAVGYFGPYLKISVTVTSISSGSDMRVKTTIRCIEEVFKDGDLIKVYCCVDMRKADMLPTVSQQSIVFNGQTLIGRYDFEQAMSLKDEGAENGAHFFDCILGEVLSSIKDGKDAIVFCQRVRENFNSFVLHGDEQFKERGLITRTLSDLLGSSPAFHIEFACFKLNNRNIYDVNDNHTEKFVKKKRTEEKFIVENLKFLPLSSSSDFENIILQNTSNRISDDKSLDYVYLFNIYRHKEKKKAPKNTLVVADLAAMRHLHQGEIFTADEQDKYKSVLDSHNALKRLIIPLADPLYTQKTDAPVERESPLATLFRQYLIANSSVSYVYELWPSSDYEREINDAFIQSNQLKKAKRQV